MHQFRLEKTGTQQLRKNGLKLPTRTITRNRRQQQPKGAARREGIGHLEVVRLLDLGGGRVDADPEDVVVGALLHHGGRLPGSRRRQLRSYTHRRTISAKRVMARNRRTNPEEEVPYQGPPGLLESSGEVGKQE
jgi:hypothetical protein